jgi:Bacteriocin-protection, YdeI or OmpD-Associated
MRIADELPGGTAHVLPDDLCAALDADADAAARWQSLTPLGRNEFICWVEDAKQPATRTRRIVRTLEEMTEGKRRPCCWAGCVHRTDKAPSEWQQAVLVEGKRK